MDLELPSQLRRCLVPSHRRQRYLGLERRTKYPTLPAHETDLLIAPCQGVRLSYQAVQFLGSISASVREAEQELQNFSAKWDDKYPTISKQWRLKWPHIITMFDLPAPIRKAIYTTNVIESVNSVIRKFTRNRKQYPNRDSALKLIYMAIHEASKKWTMPIPKWKEALNHFAILFEGRMPKNLN
jgi:hypothetical protein